MILKQKYILLIPLLMVSFLVFSGWAAYQASTRVSDVTDRDYYSKGLKYNNTLLEKRAAAAQGWQLRSEIQSGVIIQFLHDKNGEPVTGARGTLLFQQSTTQTLLTLTEIRPGVYSATLPEVRGEHLVRADFEQDGARISRRLLLTL